MMYLVWSHRSNLWKGSRRSISSERRRYRTHTHVEEEIYILGVAILESPACPLFNRRDARDEESLREPARIPRHVWEDKRYTRSTGGPTNYEIPKEHAYTEQDG